MADAISALNCAYLQTKGLPVIFWHPNEIIDWLGAPVPAGADILRAR
jgi:hypothetical protein